MYNGAGDRGGVWGADALSTGHGPIICGSQISRVTSQHGSVKKKEKKRKAPPSASNVAASAQHKRRWAGLVYKYTGKRRRRISIKTSALMGLTAVITRRRFQIRLLR